MLALIAAALVPGVAGHGAVTFPPPRNAIDSDEKPWGDTVPYPVPFEPWLVVFKQPFSCTSRKLRGV